MERWGRCPCGGTYEEDLVSVRMTSGDVEVEIPSLSRGVCPDCGGWVYGADALWHLEVLVRGVPLVVTS